MAFDISKFSAHLNKYGTIKNNRYEVIISPPASFRLAPGFQEEFKEMFDILTLRVEQVRIPNVNLNIQRVNRYGIGPRQAFPTNAVLLLDEFDVDKIDTAGTVVDFIDYNSGTDDKFILSVMMVLMLIG